MEKLFSKNALTEAEKYITNFRTALKNIFKNKHRSCDIDVLQITYKDDHVVVSYKVYPTFMPTQNSYMADSITYEELNEYFRT